eukprot:6226034-Amphidinium_carterae.1
MWQLEVSAESLLFSGLPHLLRDPALFQLARDSCVSCLRANQTLKRWKSLAVLPKKLWVKYLPTYFPYKGLGCKRSKKGRSFSKRGFSLHLTGMKLLFPLTGGLPCMRVSGAEVDTIARLCHTPADTGLLERAVRAADTSCMQWHAERHNSMLQHGAMSLRDVSASASTLRAHNVIAENNIGTP